MDVIEEICKSIVRIENKVDKISEELKAFRGSQLVDYKEDGEKKNSLDPLEDVIIPEISEYFDFSKVQKVMELLGWTWAGINGIPTVDEVKESAFNIVREAYNRKTSIYTGGFRAKYVRPEDAAVRDGYSLDKVKYPSIELEFIVDNWESTPVDEEYNINIM